MSNNKNFNNVDNYTVNKISGTFNVDFRDFNTGSIINYKKDKEKYNYDKLCMIRVENAELLFTYLEDEYFFRAMDKVFVDIYSFVQEYLKKKNINDMISYYSLNNSTIIITGKPELNEKLFTDIMRKIHKNFNYNRFKDSNALIIIRCIIVSNNSNMLECAINELHKKQNKQEQFIICDSNCNDSTTTNHEMEIINKLHWAIENNGVIPYYQGIYDNKKKCIDKYESLMRIKDKNGNVYSPAYFMETAKKYYMYTKLSEQMVCKVLQDADDYNISVSINLSASDILSRDFKNMLFERLKKRKLKSLIVFEILEDDEFYDLKVLIKFISEVQMFGIRIAIDDFGSGYSNLLEIAQLSPHYVKINGDIVIKINDSLKNRAVLESIVFLSRKINAEIVAEHVENKVIQKNIEALNIEFSQGYYFAKPVPIEKLQNNKQ